MITPSANHSNDFAEAAALYALGLLEGEELIVFERHLAGCGSCKLIVGRDRQTLEQLALAAPEMEASPDLKARILERAAAEVQQSPRPLRSAEERTRPTPLPRALTWILPLAALFVVTFAGGVTVGQLSYARQELRAVTLERTSPGVVPQGTARLVAHRSGEVVLVLRDLPPPPSGKVYQAWKIEPTGEPQPAGWISSGDGSLQLDLSVFGKRVAISVEDAPNPPKPGPDVILITQERL